MVELQGVSSTWAGAVLQGQDVVEAVTVGVLENTR
jgi:hypothetical protein